MNNRRRTLSIIIFAVALLFTGLSLAYFTQRDEATNRFKSKGYEIKLFETNWVLAGDSDAEKLEPGDIIAKDPFTFNESEDEVYVRMRIVVEIDGVDVTDTQKGKQILSCLKLSETEKLSEETTPLLDGTPVTGEDKMLLTLKEKSGAEKYTSLNPAFYYYESKSGSGTSEKVRGWFYYGSTVPGGVKLTPLPGKANTPKLFNEMVVPILKSEYYGLFDKPFKIYIIAQGVPVEKITNDDGSETLTEKPFDVILNEFDSKYGVYSFDK